MAVFFALWLVGVGLFWTMVNAHNHGESTPTATHTVAFTQHGNTKYITLAQRQRIRNLVRILMIGGPTEVLFGLVLRFAFKINVLANGPRARR